MRINLQKISIQNFRSYREQQFHFPAQPGLYYLTGINLVEPSLGANGAGKSSFFEALNWCVTGFGTSGDRASELVSWGSNRPIVEAIFDTPDERIIVRREGSPNRIYLNGKQVEQIEIDRALGTSRARFQQSVIHGQFAPFFLDLPNDKRGELLEDVLSLQEWLMYSDRAAQVSCNILDEADRVQHEVSSLKGVLESLEEQQGQSLRPQAEEWEAIRSTRLDGIKDKIKHHEEIMAGFDKQRRQPELTEDEIQREVLELTREVAEWRITQRTAEEDYNFFKEHDECPTCQQDISQEFRNEKLESIRINKEFCDKMAALAEVDLTAMQAEKQLLRQALNCKQLIELLEREVSRLMGEQNPYTHQIEKNEQRYTEVKQQQRSLTRRIQQLKMTSDKALYWRQGFRLVRLFLIRRVLDTLQLEVEAAAAGLGLRDWKIQFATERETKSGTLRHGVQVLVQSPNSPSKWSRWSGGENHRIKLAVNIGLANLIQRQAGVFYGFEIWDEPTEHLSAEGVESLMHTLEARAQMTGKQVWIADQTAPVYAGFTGIYEARKDQEGTTITQRG